MSRMPGIAVARKVAEGHERKDKEGAGLERREDEREEVCGAPNHISQ